MIDVENLPEFLSTKQIATMTGTGESMWKGMRATPGEGPPFVKMGRDTVRYPTAEFDKWLQAREAV